MAAGRLADRPTDDHVGSTVVLMEAPLMELRLLALYPEQMNIYADRGNIVFLRRRCEWRGIGFSYAAAGPGEGFDPGAHDLIYIGGGQDRDQRAVASDMVADQASRAGGRGLRRRRQCWRSAAATSCSATATSSGRSGSPGLASPTWRRSGSPASG